MNQRQMRKVAQALVRSLQRKSEPGVGYTVIVHAERPSHGGWLMALDTTLPSRPHYRALLGEALSQSVLVDGGSAEEAGEIAAGDYLAIVGGEKKDDPS